MGTGERKDPSVSGHFTVKIGDTEYGDFTQVQGLDMETEVVEYREGGNNAHTLKFRGPARYGNLVLEHGFKVSKELWDWYVKCHDEQKKLEKRNGTIVLKNSDGQTLAEWSFEKGWPVRWSGPAFQAEDGAAAVEMIEITHEKLTFTKK